MRPPGIGAFEGFVGWRYLLRMKRRPRVLVVGLALLVLGVAVTWYGLRLQEDMGLNVFAARTELPVIVMIAGGVLTAVGFCLSLFGALNTFLTAFSAFSAFMVAVGVAEVILVLGVMNGFQADLRTKIIDTHAHVVVEAATPGTYLEGYRDMAESARGAPGVVGATPYLQTEVMLTSPSNLQPAVLKGIETATVGEANKLPRQIQDGSLKVLDDPALVPPFDLDRHPAFRDPATEAQRMNERIRALEAEIREMEAEGDRRDGAPSPDPAGDAPADEDAGLREFGMEMPHPGRATAGPPPALLLGAELRRNLNLWPGENVNVVSPLGDLGPEGPVPKSRPFRVGGWFRSEMLEFDTRLAYASMEAVQRYLGLDDVAGAIQVQVADLEGARAVRDHLQAKLGATVRVMDWQELNSSLFSALKLEKVAMFLVLSINILLAAFSITGTMVMTIIERRRQIAILGAMGADSGRILRVFMSQGAFTGAVGAAIGATLGLAAGTGLARLRLPMDNTIYYIDSIPVDVRAVDVVAIVLVALLISLVSTIYPALYAARLRPVEGLTAE